MRSVATLALWLAVVATCGAQDLNNMRGFRAPFHDEEGVLQYQVFGDVATFQDDGSITITNLRLETYRDGKDLDLKVTAPNCVFFREQKFGRSEGSVRIEGKNMVITGTGYEFRPETQRFAIREQARVVVKHAARPDGSQPKGEEP